MDPTYRARLFNNNPLPQQTSIVHRKNDRCIPEHNIENIQLNMIENIERLDLADHGYWKPIVQKESHLDILHEGFFNEPRREQSQNILQYRSVNHPVKNILQDRTYQLQQAQNIENNLQQCRVSLTCNRTLGAPGISTDFYTNVLDVSSKNTLALALGKIVYATSVEKSNMPITTFLPFNDEVSCVHWIAQTDQIFTGLTDGSYGIIHTTAQQIMKKEGFTKGWISSASSGLDPNLVYYGDRSYNIVKMDLRTDQEMAVGSKKGAICSMALSPDERKLAVGTNNDKVMIYDLANGSKPYATFSCFKAAVKALAWSPWERGVLFAGGGSADPTIRALSVPLGKVLASSDKVSSQFTAIHPIAENNKLISCHGYQGNSSALWNYRNGKFCYLSPLPDSHKGRVLHSSLNADRTELITGSEDQTVKFWSLVKQPEKVEEVRQNTPWQKYHTNIR
ncbi:MAG: WD40 repeat domain-containing protein [Verrucomicrobia bacterium]|nr:WD40 repeat domain-containing protein [Verrucomicrobiota bacterium]